MPEMKAVLLPPGEEDEQAEWDSLVSLKLLTRNTRLVEARKAKGVTQVQMAKDIGMRAWKLSHIENIKFTPSNVDQATIGAYLEQPLDHLFPDILMRAIESGVFKCRDVQLREPEIISLTEAARLQLTHDGETEMINQIYRDQLPIQINAALDTLDPRLQRVLRLRFGLDGGSPKTLAEVATYFNVGRERIRQMESKALRLLRHPSRARMLKDYLNY